MNTWKEGDVFSWWYKEVDHNSSTQYWCCSQTGIVQNDGRLYDTYWGYGANDGRSFSLTSVGDKIEVKFVANLNDYNPCRKEDQCYYNDEDFLNLSNSNNSGKYYLRKGAVKSLDKMRKILQRNVKDAERKLIKAKQDLEWEKRKLSELTIDSYVYANNDVSVEDVSYLDEEIM